MTEPTTEQSSILSAVRSTGANLMIEALAGTGKTSTLEMVERESDTRPILYLVFNKKNAEEAEKRMLSTTTVRTFNSLGHRVWSKTAAKVTLDSKKVPGILKDIISALRSRSARDEAWDEYWNVIHGVAMAKALGYIPADRFPQARRLISQEALYDALDEKPSPACADLIDEVLFLSIKTAYNGFIDFNDQIYMPTLFGGTFPRFPLVMVDEYQDLNPVNHAMLDKLARDRLIGVGDPWQSIYGFRGAKQNGMGFAKAQFKMEGFPLSVSFRCPQAVVEAARWRVPHFQWVKEGGHVEALDNPNANTIPDGSAIICRNNAPLFRLALNFLVHKRPVSVSGSDIGPKLLGIMKKLGEDSMPKASLLSAIEDWRAERKAKESKTADDMADCMKVFAGFGETLSQAVGYAEHIFKQQGAIRLLTGHKSKGLEFDNVYFLDSWLCRDDEQDQNLRYVIQTRAKQNLFEIDSGRITWTN